ncbi:uncharacterized protein YbjT (DUF2867 family) [Haloactinospora alba]|uniref:Uncharacterized protein YbjT (DUF2867 family) n=1 Tax=Haloactinospora alba TaxID=405555 RepID=A0A543NIJ6_9ACTN|nr:NAD(P)H-binding protein [Haloactinospora alba]TQN31657.1 uncharacterized protein YbjT (DUF2867 family) [Haloactinospora alba]
MIVVTGATGNIGAALVRQLNASGVPLRALTRDANRAQVPSGVEVIEGDPQHTETLKRSLDGADRIFLIPQAVGGTAPVLETARHLGVRHVVLVSSLLAQTHPESFIGRSARKNEQEAQDSGLAWTLLRPWEFASNTLAWAPTIRGEGTVRVPFSGLPSPAVHPSDIAAVAARALSEEGHHTQTYPLTGPQSLTPREKTQAIATAVGRELRFDEYHSPQELRRIADEAPDHTAQGLMVPGVCALESPGALSTVQTVTGSPARTFQQWVHDNSEAFN